MNKRGSTIFVSLMLAIVLFVMGLALGPALASAMSENLLQLNCTTDYLINTSISHQDRAICTQIDLMAPLFSGIIFGMAGFLLGGIAIR